jgi:hypothetical protein
MPQEEKEEDSYIYGEKMKGELYRNDFADIDRKESGIPIDDW